VPSLTAQVESVTISSCLGLKTGDFKHSQKKGGLPGCDRKENKGMNGGKGGLVPRKHARKEGTGKLFSDEANQGDRDGGQKRSRNRLQKTAKNVT